MSDNVVISHSCLNTHFYTFPWTTRQASNADVDWTVGKCSGNTNCTPRVKEFPEHDFPSILMQSGLRTSYIPHISGAAGRLVLT